MKNLFLFCLFMLLFSFAFNAQGAVKPYKQKQFILTPLPADFVRMTWIDGCVAGTAITAASFKNVHPNQVNLQIALEICQKMAAKLFKKTRKN